MLGPRRASSFQSTLPVWGGTAAISHHRRKNQISIHPPRVGRDGIIRIPDNAVQIFQSTLPVWGGTEDNKAGISAICISIHPPRVGRDGSVSQDPCLSAQFQSTLPVWGGTSATTKPETCQRNFNPPSPCGEGLDRYSLIATENKTFQSTLPVWGGTAKAHKNSL